VSVRSEADFERFLWKQVFGVGRTWRESRASGFSVSGGLRESLDRSSDLLIVRWTSRKSRASGNVRREVVACVGTGCKLVAFPANDRASP
jgi:hypothetical protein